MPTISLSLVRWPNTLFLGGTLLLALTAAPVYLWNFGLSWFQGGLFLALFIATGLSITLGYHRLFAHLSFKARWPVRLLTLVFGSAAFENSALCWAADHRRHHKFVDGDNDPYDITKGFFHAHIGWILFRLPPETTLDGVKDLQADRLVMWQHRNCVLLGVVIGFLLPAFLGFLVEGWRGALGGFLLAGVARVVAVHHMTFFINSMCHTLGRRPYSTRCTARDSMLMALFTFGEGYHNFHHEFQHDYRNGVKPWQFDPTKWSIWLLNKCGLVTNLRRVATEKILLAQAAEEERQIAVRLSAKPTPVAESVQRMVEAAKARLHQASVEWEQRRADYLRSTEQKMEASREKIAQMRRELREARRCLRAAWQEWRQTQELALAQLA